MSVDVSMNVAKAEGSKTPGPPAASCADNSRTVGSANAEIGATVMVDPTSSCCFIYVRAYKFKLSYLSLALVQRSVLLPTYCGFIHSLG